MKKFTLSVLVLFVLALSVNAVFAQRVNPQQPNDPGMLRQIVTVITEQTGMTPIEVARALQADGATLASVIASNGGDVDAVVEEVVGIITAHVNAQLEAGAISAARAERQLTNLDAIVREALAGEGLLGNARGNVRDRMGERGRGGLARPNMERPQNRPLPDVVGTFGIRPLIVATADALGLDYTAITRQLRAGETLSAIIDANGGDQDAIIRSALAIVDERLSQAVEIGRISAEQKSALLSVMQTFFTEFMNLSYGAA